MYRYCSVVFICPVWVCVGNKLYTPQIHSSSFVFHNKRNAEKTKSFSTHERLEEWMDVGWSVRYVSFVLSIVLFFLPTDYVLFSHFLFLFLWSLLFSILFWRLVPHVVFYNFASLLCSFPALVFKKYYFIYWFLFFHNKQKHKEQSRGCEAHGKLKMMRLLQQSLMTKNKLNK